MSKKILIPAAQNGLFGAIDLSGSIVIPAKYQLLGFFNEGLAVVQQYDKYGFINKAGQLVVPCLYGFRFRF